MHLGVATTNKFPSSAAMTYSDELFQTVSGAHLQAAIDTLYAAFGDTRLEEPFGACPHCYTDADRSYLQNTAVRALTFADAASILTSAISTLGSPSDLNYFLPRILETWAHKGHYMAEVLPEKLKSAREAGWTQQQLDAVATFVSVMFAAINELKWNAVWYSDLSDQVDAFKRILPEAADAIQIKLNDKDALPSVP